MRFLLVEDDRMLGGSLSTLLRRAGDAVDWEQTRENALAALATTEYDAVLLDLGLPDGNGTEILKTLRGKKNSVPVLVITARDALDERIKNLDLGADDYILKPFAFEELQARIRARLRRAGDNALPKITIGGFELDPAGKSCAIDGKAVSLSRKEYAILLTLAQHPQRYFSRAQLEEKIYDWSQEIESNALEYHIHRLRKKCGKDIILNQRGLGYRFGKEASCAQAAKR